MKDKKLIIISLVGLILLVALCMLLFVLAGAFNRSINKPVSYPDNPGNIIDIGSETKEMFSFAVITNTDTIELRNRVNERTIINLENRKWKDLKWSPNNKNISVLGESKAGIYDLYLYSLENKTWQRITNYLNLENGITSYGWVDGTNIYLKQGPEQDSWVHRLNIESLANGVIKVFKRDGEIYKIGQGRSTIVLKNTSGFAFFNLVGDEINSMNQIAIISGKSASGTETILDLFFTKNSEQVIYVTPSGNILADVTSKEGLRLETSAFNIICTKDTSEIYGYSQEGSILSYIESNSEDDSIVNKITLDLNRTYTVNPSASICYNSKNLLIAINLTDISRWYTVDGDQLVQAIFTTDLKEISALNN